MSQSPPQIVVDLVDQFTRNIDSYRSPGYNEANLRIQFLNPLFEALGWDVTNRLGKAEAYKDVIHEDAIKVGGTTKAPDYCFRIGGTRKFFLEAKKPAVNLKDEISPAYQLRRYAWSAKLPLSVLTDFEEFAIYDCRTRPGPSDKPATSRTLYLTYKDYLTKWDEIASIFSKEAIEKGSFDKYAGTDRKRGTATVDTEFLAEIEHWREVLAKNLAVRNPRLSVHNLNFAVQRTIDRIIFLRICEDRGVEHDGQLQALLNGEHVYGRLRELYTRADDRYNSGLFHFQAEKDRAEAPDTITPSLKIDDKVLKDILKRLYYPDSPYEFSVFPAEILGQVYEQFLGKVIRLTVGHQAKVEEKPEVKKAGGVFYTPAYIVEYIVRHTVGSLCKDKTPRQIEKLRILDPACGSGSFLIGAYDYLMNYHRDWYVKDGPDKHKKELFRAGSGEWRLTTQEKKRILLNNIYGVDIDNQAVEVTKLSLLLKVLEGESDETLKRQLSFVKERALPDLGKNIKCGNSLIGTDYFAGQLLPDEDAMRRINPFDWQAGFPEVMRASGFDAVIGNPPYVRIQTMQEWIPEAAEIFKRSYESAKTGNYDIYVVFVERGLSLLNTSGRLGFIMPQKFCQVQYGEALRALLAAGKNVDTVVSFTNNQVFDAAFVNTCILILSKTPKSSLQYVEVPKVSNDLSLSQALASASASTLPGRFLSEAPWVLKPAKTMVLIEKLAKRGLPLDEGTTRIFQGLKTSADKIYVLELKRETARSIKAHSIHLNRDVELERGLCHKLIKGTEMRPYVPLPAERVIIFPYIQSRDSVQLIEEDELKRKFPKTYKYLKANERYLREREDGSMNHAGWYGYGRTQALDVMPLPKLITPDLAPRSSFLLDPSGELFFLGGAAGGYGLLPRGGFNSLYLLGLLNSRALNFFITSSGQQMESGYYSFESRFIHSAPICSINFSDKSEKAKHDKMVSLVERMLDLHKRLAATKTPTDQERLKRQIDATNREIDRLVYDLYGLTEEEIKVIEGTNM